MWLEIFGVITGILYVILEVRQNKWLWPLGIVTSAVYVYVFFSGKFYADMGLQVYYVLISIYGWYYWSRGIKNSGIDSSNTKVNSVSTPKVELPVTRIQTKTAFVLFLIFMAIWLGIFLVLKEFTDSSVPVGDSFTTAMAVVATWMLARKIIEHWFLWIISNAVSIGLYSYKGLYPTIVLYAVYFGMAIYGYFEWQKSMNSFTHAKQ